MADKKKIEYTALVGFSVKGKAVEIGTKCPDYDKRTTDILLANERMAPSDSDEAKEVVERIKARAARAEKDRKAAEAAGRAVPGVK